MNWAGEASWRWRSGMGVEAGQAMYHAAEKPACGQAVRQVEAGASQAGEQPCVTQVVWAEARRGRVASGDAYVGGAWAPPSHPLTTPVAGPHCRVGGLPGGPPGWPVGYSRQSRKTQGPPSPGGGALWRQSGEAASPAIAGGRRCSGYLPRP